MVQNRFGIMIGRSTLLKIHWRPGGEADHLLRRSVFLRRPGEHADANQARRMERQSDSDSREICDGRDASSQRNCGRRWRRGLRPRRMRTLGGSSKRNNAADGWGFSARCRTTGRRHSSIGTRFFRSPVCANGGVRWGSASERERIKCRCQRMPQRRRWWQWSRSQAAAPLRVGGLLKRVRTQSRFRANAFRGGGTRGEGVEEVAGTVGGRAGSVRKKSTDSPAGPEVNKGPQEEAEGGDLGLGR
jgi:hypothetical protein